MLPMECARIVADLAPEQNEHASGLLVAINIRDAAAMRPLIEDVRARHIKRGLGRVLITHGSNARIGRDMVGTSH